MIMMMTSNINIFMIQLSEDKIHGAADATQSHVFMMIKITCQCHGWLSLSFYVKMEPAIKHFMKPV